MTRPFIISCSTIALRGRPVSEAIDIIADAGFNGIEFLYPHLEKLTSAELHAVATHCANRQLVPTVISPYFSFTRDAEWIRNSLKTAREAIDIAAVLGIKKIRTFVDIGPDGVSSAVATEGHWRQAIEGLQELCSLAPELTFVVETHQNTLADTLPGVLRLLEEVNRSNLALNFQGNVDFLRRGYRQVLESLLPYVRHMHWQQYMREGGETYIEEPGLVDFRELVGWLAAKNFTETASVEYCWLPIQEYRLKTAVRYLECA